MINSNDCMLHAHSQHEQLQNLQCCVHGVCVSSLKYLQRFMHEVHSNRQEEREINGFDKLPSR